MSNRKQHSGFRRTHQTCPCPLREKKCFSTFNNDQSSGYCFACARVVRGNRGSRPSSQVWRTEEPSHHQKFIPHDAVTETTWPIVDLVSTFGNVEGHRDAIANYGELRAQGLDHSNALKQSGYAAIASSRLPEISWMIRQLPGFFQDMTYITGVPDILTAFNVGCGTEGQVIFWITDARGRTCNAQCIYYDGLTRSKNRPTSYMYRSTDGYLVSALFGAEQLQPNSVSWTKQPFDPFAPIFVVESPKTAMLAAVTYPDIIWLASCGASGVTRTKAQALRGREVHILFDNDSAGRNGARQAMRVLLEVGSFPRILDPEVVFGGPRPDGWDLGDEVLNLLGAHP